MGSIYQNGGSKLVQVGEGLTRGANSTAKHNKAFSNLVAWCSRERNAIRTILISNIRLDHRVAHG